jgi:HEAT repeat protein
MMKHKEAVAPLIRILEDPEADERLKAMAATSLGKFETPSIMLEGGEVSTATRLLAALQTTQPPVVRRSAMMALANVWYDGLGSSLIDVHANVADPWVRNLSLLVCAEKVTNPAVKAQLHRRLRKIVSEPRGEPNLANFAAIASGLSGDTEAIPLLRRFFQRQKKDDAKGAAAVGLGFLKDTDSIPMLLEGMRESDSPFLKTFCSVAFALMEKPDPRVSQALRAILADPKNTGHLRATASLALAKMGDFSAVQLLLKFLDKGNRGVRQLMVLSVGYFRDLGTYIPLKQFYEKTGKDYELKALTLVALGFIVEKEHPPLLKKPFLFYNYLLLFPNLTRIYRLM